MRMLVDLHEVYPRVKVRVQEEEEDPFPPPNDTESSSLFLSLIESLSKLEKENQINSPPSIPRTSKAYVKTPPTKSLSASKAAGTVKKKEKVGKDTKSNIAKANSVPPPRAVLSSPDNDGMIGSRNKLNYERSAALRKRPAEQIKPAILTQNHKNVNLNPNVTTTHGSPNFRKGPKTEISGLAGRMQKEPLKPPVLVQRQKAHSGNGRKSSSLGIKQL